jgi:isocitrate dehydrogenase (NAD+)
VLVRENTEGLYVGFEHYIPIGDDPHAVAIGSGVNTRAGCRRIAEYAFEYAVNNGRKKVTVVHKANILKALTAVGFDAEDVPASQALRTFLRELLARVDAVLEVTLFRQSLAERNARLR